MTTKDEVARRVAERLGLTITYEEDGTFAARDDYQVLWDALISSEMRVEELNFELQKRDKCAYIGPLRDCPTHGESERLQKAEARVGKLQEELREIIKINIDGRYAARMRQSLSVQAAEAALSAKEKENGN